MEGLRGERAVVVDDLRHLVDVVLLRVAIFLVAAVVFAPLVAHAYARCLAAVMARAADMIARTGPRSARASRSLNMIRRW
jgi:hypothetical protein